MSRVLLAAFATLFMSQVAFASPTYTYVGSWTVDQGPDWTLSSPNGSLAYTGQEAAAKLFGGTASDYAISTVNNQVASIDHLAWYSVLLGVSFTTNNGGSKFAENYSKKYLGQYYGPTSGYAVDALSTAPASAYVHDNALQSVGNFTNFAFRISNDTIASPEPASMTMFGVMLVSGAIAFRRRNAAAKA